MVEKMDRVIETKFNLTSILKINHHEHKIQEIYAMIEKILKEKNAREKIDKSK